MDKQELINELYVRLSTGSLKYAKWELVAVVEPFIDILVEILSNGKDVRVKNLGRFVVKIKKGHKYYNICAKKFGYTSEKRVITFIPCKSLRVKSNTYSK